MSFIAHCHPRGTDDRVFDALFFLLLLFLSLFGWQILAQSVPDPSDSCSATQPCAVGCCDNFGICGMGPDFCGPGNCVNSCDAKAECDPAGWGPQYVLSEACPLNVCCSQFGFCGTTPEFCGDKVVTNPSCPGGSSASGRNIGYYEGWAITRPCDVMLPATIPWIDYTHINFAFATIDPVSFQIVPSSPTDPELYLQLTSLKSLIPGLQVWISIGGWSFTDLGEPTATTFSDLAGSAANQLAFSNSLISFMSTYGFDGVDIDWEYPVAPDRNGSPGDFANYPIWLSQLRGAFNNAGTNYGLSITLPSSFWYLQHFDVVALEPLVDWFNMMEYDLHGTWDATDVWIGPYVAAHTNLTEIDESLKLLWNNNINPSKVTLGLGFYGRTYTLQDPTCVAPGCPFTGGAPAGPCTQSVGTLSYAELENIIATQGGTVTEDTTAAVNIVTWGDGYWASFDTAATFQLKVDYANNNCLGGTMVWAASLDDASGTAANALAAARSGSVPNSAWLTNLLATQNSNSLAGCVVTGCSLTPGCPSGMTLVQQTSLGCYGPLFDGLPEGNPANSFCCPSNNVPSCNYAAPVFQSTNPQCSTPACPIGTRQIFQGYAPSGTCPLNAKNYCCSDPQGITARDVGCFWTECGTGTPTCPSGTAELVTATLGQNGANTCLDGTVQSLCCPTPFQINPGSCSWEHTGIFGFCLPELNCLNDNQIPVAGDINHGGCTLGLSTFCCDPPSNEVIAVTAGVADFATVANAFFAGGTCSSGLSSSPSSKRAFENTFELAVRRRNSSSLLRRNLGEANELDLILRYLVYGEDPASDESNDSLDEWDDPLFYSNSSNPKKKRQNLSILIGTVQFAERLVPALYEANVLTGQDQYIQPFADEYDTARINAGSNAPSWSSLVSLVGANINSPNLIPIVAGSLCNVIVWDADPIICSAATCSTNVCPANIPTIDKRVRGATPADVTAQGTSGVNDVTAGGAFTDPSTFPGIFGDGSLNWWMDVKNLDWWLGSNHGISTSGQEIASSAWVDFATNPGSNLFTGAGPVWGCTTVAVISPLGAWTAHFWQGFFTSNNPFTFLANVIDFLRNGNHGDPENYQGLLDLMQPGGILDPVHASWIRVVIMTPQNYEQVTAPLAFGRPIINPLPGELYPNQVSQIESTIRGIFASGSTPVNDFALIVETYGADQSIWSWFYQPTFTNGRWSLQWRWWCNRAPRLINAPWTGMMTIQRSATNVAGVTPAVRIWVEDAVVLVKDLDNTQIS